MLRTISQTPAPKSDRIKGSKTNKAGSAASKKSASSIVVSDKVLKTLKDKADKHNENHTNKVSVNTLKAVFRRGSGAYSTSHRPTITGGAPNSRNAWSFARVNKFLLKKGGTKVKAAYVQDDDLLEKGGDTNSKVANITFMKWVIEYNVNNKDEILAFFSLPSKYINPSLVSENNNNVILDVFEKQKDDIDAKKHFQKMLDKADELGVTIYLEPIPRVHKLKSNEHKQKITKDYLIKYYNNFGFTKDKNGFMVRHPKMAKGGSLQNSSPNGNKKLDDFRYSTYNYDNVANVAAAKKSSMRKGGDCYYAAGQLALRMGMGVPSYIGTPYLVHAEVQGQGQLSNIRYGHAWIEDDENVYDFSNNRELVIPKIIYYAIGNIKTDNPLKYIKYTFEEARIKMIETKNYGCWDLDVEYKDGGQVGENEKITCSNCSWQWDTTDSAKKDQYVCHKCGFDNSTDIRFDKGGKIDKLIDDGVVELKMFSTTNEHSKIYGFDAENPLYIQSLIVSKSHRMKGIGTNVMNYIVDYADKNGHDLIFGNITQKAEPNIDVIKSMIVKSGFNTIDGNNDFYKWNTSTDKLKDGGVVVGKRHSESDENGSGEKFLVKSTGQVVELEGGEGVLNATSMQSAKIFNFNGNKMTARQIASELNHKYGGVEFAKGGDLKDHVCGCKFFHGGELPTATVDSLEGGEAIVTVKTMESKDNYNFNGREMTPRQILAKINEEFGGKKFEDGGTIDLKKHKFEKEVRMAKMVYFVENILYL